jgi:membrane-bound ClpP family serine protease
MTLLITLVVIGILFLLLEILVIPGTTVAGIIGSVMVGIAVWQAYDQYGQQTGLIFLGITVFITLVALYFALKGKTWKRMMLNEEVEGKVNYFEHYQPKTGDEGVTVSRLSPMGKARFNEDYFEVTSYSGYIEPNMPVVIVSIEGNKIIVKIKNQKK